MATFNFGELITADIYPPSLWYKVRLATATNINVAADLTTVSIDGITPTAGQQILLVGQTTTSQNGVWTIVAGAGLSFQPPARMNGVIVFVIEGSTNANKAWVCTTPPPNDLAGVNALTFAQTLGAGVDGNATIDGVETFTNKTLTDPSNTIAVSSLATTGADVVISGAAAPTASQVLRATSATTATWQAAPSGAGETNTASNVGTVNASTRQVFKQKVGVDLQFRGLAPGNSTLLVTESAGLITIATNPAGMNINNIDTINAPFVANREHGGTGIASPAAQNFLFYNGLVSALGTIAAPVGDVVTNTAVQTLTNKTINTGTVVGTDAVQRIRFLRTATGTVDLSSGTAPNIGTFLTATSATTAVFSAANVYGSFSQTSTTAGNTTSTTATFVNRNSIALTNPRPPGRYKVYAWGRLTTTANATTTAEFRISTTISAFTETLPIHSSRLVSSAVSTSWRGIGFIRNIDVSFNEGATVTLQFRGNTGSTTTCSQTFLAVVFSPI